MRQLAGFPRGEIWWIDLAETPDAAAVAALPDEELNRASRFAHARHGQRYLAAHVALRQLLARKSGIAGTDLRMETGPHGKPRIPGIPWCFNLSHSGDEALVALSTATEVGVDIEVIAEIEDVEDLARQYFTPHELARWLGMAIDKRLRAFYEIWTRKEACVKAAGWGLNLPLQEFETGFASDTPCAVSLPLPTGKFTRMALVSLALESGSAAAVAWLLD